jgi:hypothetical protein
MASYKAASKCSRKKTPLDHRNDELWSSLASSSALVSETIVDSWHVDKLQVQVGCNGSGNGNDTTETYTDNDTQRQEVAQNSNRVDAKIANNGFPMGDENEDENQNSSKDTKGVNRHNYSPESLRRILEHQEKVNQALCPVQTHKLEEGDELGQVPSDNGRGNGNGRLLPAVASSVAGAAGFISRWVQVQKIKRQKEALQTAVEEQRRILLQQSLCCTEKKRPKRHTGQREIVKEQHFMPNFNSGLEGNVTFKNITSTDNPRKTISALSFCGGSSHVNDNDAYDSPYDSYFDDESRQTFDEYIASVQNSRNQHLNHQNYFPNDVHHHHHDDDDDETGISYDSYRTGDEGTFMIGSPCHTLSGQGVAVQLEILQRPSPSLNNADHDYEDETKVIIQHEQNTIPYILNPDQMKSIAINGLPASIMFSKWKRLYSLQRDGDSFTSSFLKKVKGEARTLLVVQTTKNEIMGGYSNSPWESQSGSVGAAFYGSCQASLFKICKNSSNVEVFNWTGCNRYVQVCDIHAKLLAFGGGGKDGAFGLCIEDDFSVGTTGKCETFNNDPLCDEGRFEIMNVECWGFLPGF